MTQNQKMRDFVKSLENNQFSKEQEAMLLVGKADTLQAGSNGKCENRSSSCDLSRDCRLMFTICAKQRLVPSVFCTRLINFSSLYLVPAISAGFFVISHTPGYSNPR